MTQPVPPPSADAAYRALLTSASEMGALCALVESRALVVGLGTLDWAAQHWTGATATL
ncbi:hypothetical protein HMI49_22955 [Corallococcus exercitus]|uniref:Uncharacterized protein n=1 Tax=Corallococcus exercitus TaxID=2316736 RepID=A0A7Y4NTR6_9BACT|nr:hypothetical protein [Corallococcus exercitus]NOK36066.1 hypothetical protein [Corallococcus exercitus]